MGDRKPRRHYPPVYERLVPIGLVVIGLIILVLLVIIVAVALGLLPGVG